MSNSSIGKGDDIKHPQAIEKKGKRNSEMEIIFSEMEIINWSHETLPFELNEAFMWLLSSTTFAIWFVKMQLTKALVSSCVSSLDNPGEIQ